MVRNKKIKQTCASLRVSVFSCQLVWVSFSSSPSADIWARRARTRAWTLTNACMHLRVIAACFLTCRPRTNACILTIAFNALKALLAYILPNIILNYVFINQQKKQKKSIKMQIKPLRKKLLKSSGPPLSHLTWNYPPYLYINKVSCRSRNLKTWDP